MSSKSKKRSEPVPLAVRVEKSTRDELDRMAQDLGLSRAQLVGRLLRDVVRAEKSFEDEGLFGEWREDFERAVERALSDAIRAGGIDQVIARHGKKGAKK